ncbi:MAG: hypothetical protein IJI75_01260 [Solobacterium sp.]|nr:hypothetical protein [Solobacterium sp.]
MSNIIRLNKAAPNDEWIVMSNQGTDCFLDLLIAAADNFEKTEQQKELISFLKDQKDINTAAPGTAGFDLDELPWSKDTLSEDVSFMLEIIRKAGTVEAAEKLDYRPNLKIVTPWLDRFSLMIWKLDKDYLYGTEEKDLVKHGIEAIRTILCGNNCNAKRRLLFYLDKYLDPYYQNDLSELYKPLKELLQEVVISDNEADVIEEARYLLEAYMEME